MKVLHVISQKESISPKDARKKGKTATNQTRLSKGMYSQRFICKSSDSLWKVNNAKFWYEVFNPASNSILVLSSVFIRTI